MISSNEYVNFTYLYQIGREDITVSTLINNF